MFVAWGMKSAAGLKTGMVPVEAHDDVQRNPSIVVHFRSHKHVVRQILIAEIILNLLPCRLHKLLSGESRNRRHREMSRRIHHPRHRHCRIMRVWHCRIIHRRHHWHRRIHWMHASLRHWCKVRSIVGIRRPMLTTSTSKPTPTASATTTTPLRIPNTLIHRNED